MSQVHRVIILNKPLKIRGFTIRELIVMAIGILLGFVVALNTPQDWKLGNLQAGFLFGLTVFSLSLAVNFATQTHPFAWWKNVFFYSTGLASTEWYPHPEPGQVFPDPTLIEAAKAEDDFYVR